MAGRERLQRLWRRFFPNEQFHVQCFYDRIARHANSAQTMLDLGCGDHRLLAPFRSNGRQVWGVDFQRHPQLFQPEWFRVLNSDGTIPFSDESFDVITAAWVLEHVESPPAFLSEARRVLKPGGTLIAHSINGLHPLTFLRRAMDVFPENKIASLIERLYKRPTHDTFPTHYRLNTRQQLHAGARRAGLKLSNFEYFADPGYYMVHPAVMFLGTLMDWSLELLSPGSGRIYFVCELQKPAGNSSLKSAA